MDDLFLHLIWQLRVLGSFSDLEVLVGDDPDAKALTHKKCHSKTHSEASTTTEPYSSTSLTVPIGEFDHFSND